MLKTQKPIKIETEVIYNFIMMDYDLYCNVCGHFFNTPHKKWAEDIADEHAQLSESEHRKR